MRSINNQEKNYKPQADGYLTDTRRGTRGEGTWHKGGSKEGVGHSQGGTATEAEISVIYCTVYRRALRLLIHWLYH